MLRVATLNVNGLRAAVSKGLMSYLSEQQYDVIALQEVRAQPSDLTGPEYDLAGYERWLCCGDKKGYSGVAIYARHPGVLVESEVDPLFSEEGRLLEVAFDFGNVVSLYLPSGTSGDVRQQQKDHSLHCLKQYLQRWQKRDRPMWILGDFNMAHQAMDLARPKPNEHSPGFLPHERAFITEVLRANYWLDAFRAHHPNVPGYTWWTYRGRAFENDVGWRIDYHWVSPHWHEKMIHMEVIREPRVSDHALLVGEYQP